LLVGAPGTGKTLLARAVAGEAGVPFFSISGSEFIQMFVGVGASRVRDMFKTAKENAPCLLFIDEIDAVGRMRGAGVGGGSDEREQTLNQILSEMDGFQPNESVIVIAATNRPWDLDSAVLSRFEKKILIPLPETSTRERILRIHLEKKGFTAEVPYPDLAAMTDGYSGREIERFCKEVTTGMIEESNHGIPALVDQWLDMVKKYKIKIRPLTKADFDAAARLIHPQTTPEEMKKYYDWKESAEEE